MIDLSFLTDEEQEAILKVLQRDANLKRAEEERVRHLPEKVDDEIQIKNMSGQWFYEVKSKRHRDKIHGADIIRASMRRKPLTAAELSQNKTGKKQKSWVNNVNKEVLTPPELFGAIEEAEGESKSSLSPTAFNADATPQEGTKKAAVSPSKERKNPFNNSNLLEENADRKGGISSSSETSKKDSLLPSVEYQPEVNIANGRLEKPELASVEPNDPNGQTGKPPIPRARKNIHKTSDVSVTSEDSFSKAPRRIQPGNGQGTPPRGILKRNSSTSSTDSEVLRLNQTGDPSYKNGLPASTILEGVVDKNSYPGRDPEGFSQNSLERAKQVRFSSSVSRKERPPSLDLHEGKESGEFGLLDSDCGKTGGDRARGSDSLQDEQTPPIKPLASTSMDLNGHTEDQATSREGNADLVSYNADGSGILQSQESSPAEFGASSDSPRETFPKVTKEPSRDEAKLEIKTGQRSPGPDAKPSSAGQPLPLANAEDPRAPSAVSADLEQGKPVFVGDPSAKTPSKSDKQAAEASKAADESISKVLDWFKRSSSTDSEGTAPSSASQGREPSEETRKLATTKEENALSQDIVNLDPLCDSKALTTKDIFFHDGGSQPELLSFAQNRHPSRLLPEEQRFSRDGKGRDIAEPRDQRSAPFQATSQEMNYAGETNLLEEADGGSKAEGETAACREPKFADGVKLGLSADSSGKEREVENSTRADGERSVSSYIKGGSFEHQAGVLLKEGEESGLPEKGIVQRDASADRRNLPWMQHQEIKQTSPIEDQKRIKDIRAFWEKEQTSPRSGNQEDLLTKNTSINKGTHGYKSESRKIKPAGESLGYVRGESDSEEGKYNLVTFRRVELSDDSEPNDSNVNLSLRRIKPELTDKSQGGSPVTRSSKTLPSNWKGAGFTESTEAGNLKTGNDAMLSPKKGRDIQTVALAKDKMSSTLQQKPNFTVHSLKEKVNEESKSEMLNPSQFQSLRSFWGAGVKPQGRIEEAKETRIPHSNSGGTSQQPSMEIKGVRDEAGQICLEEEEQKSETNEGFLKATPNQPLLANEASRKSLRFVPQENSYLVELAVSEPLEKMTPPGKEVEESVERTVVPSKMQPILFNRDLQKLLIQTSQESLPAGLLSDERGAPKETEGQTHTDHAIQHRTVSTDVSSNVGHSTSEIAETVHRTVIPPNVDVDSFNAGIERLVKEALDARPSSDGSGAVNTSKQSAPPSEERSFYNKVMQLSRNAHPTDQAKRDVVPQSLEKRVSTSDQNVRFKTEGDAPAETRGINSALRTAPNHKEFQVYQDVSSQKKDLRIPSPTLILPDARLAALNRAETPGKEVSDMVTESRVPLKRENHDLNSQLLILLKETSEFPSVSCMTESVSKAAAGGLPGEGQEASYQQVMATSALPSPATVSLSRETSREKTEKRDDGFGRMGEDPNGETAMVFPFVNQKNVRGQSHDQGRGDVTSVGKLVELQLKEVAETVVKTVKPNALEPTRFKDSLNNLMKEDSQVVVRDIEFPKPVFVSLCPSNGEKDMPPFQEIHESVEKATVPSNSVYGEFQTNFRKLLMEDTTFLPSNQDGRKMERTANDKSEPNQMSGLVGRQEVGLQEVEETVHKTVVPAKRQQNELNSGLQKLLAEFSHMSPAQIQELGEKLKAKLQTGQGVEETGDLSQDSVEKSVAPSEETVFDSYSGKLTKEDSGASLQLSKDRNLEAPYDSTSQSEDRNVLVTMPALIRRSSSDYRSELKIPLKGKASKPDVQVPADGKISVVPVGNLFSQKIEQVNLLSAEAPLPGKEESSPTVAKADETETGYDTQRDTGVVSSANVTLDGGTEEMDVLLGPRRTSTPRAEQETPPRLSQVELILAVRHRKNEEDEGARSFGSDLSNESIDYSLAESKRNSTCSAEDPNPVLEALKRSSNRQIPSKSLEDIPSATSNEGKVNTRKEDLMLSAEDVSAAPSFPVNQFSNPEKVKRMSKSVPMFLQEESDGRETDTASESSYSLGKIKKSPSSLTNLSGSSGLASLSSVSTSVVSVYSGDFGNVDVKGNIQFAIDYVEQLKELHIFIAQCKDLAVADVKKQRSDPYVKCYLLPEKYKLGKRKTSVKKKTLNPVYNEILRYKVDKILLTSQRLNISVWHNDTFGRNSFLGEVDLDLGSWDWDDRQIKQMIWYPLKPRAPLASLELENRGEIKLSLQYIPQPDGGKKPSATGEVHIWVKECHDLPLLKGNKLNTFVKCTVLPDTSRKSRQKTRAVAKATNPVFNHTMVYDGFKFEDLKEACVELTVWDHKQLVNHFLGGLRIGLGTGKSYGTAVDWMDSTLEETSLWERMMNSPDQWVEGTLPLRMLTIAKMTK